MQNIVLNEAILDLPTYLSYKIPSNIVRGDFTPFLLYEGDNYNPKNKLKFLLSYTMKEITTILRTKWNFQERYTLVIVLLGSFWHGYA